MAILNPYSVLGALGFCDLLIPKGGKGRNRTQGRKIKKSKRKKMPS